MAKVTADDVQTAREALLRAKKGKDAAKTTAAAEELVRLRSAHREQLEKAGERGLVSVKEN